MSESSATLQQVSSKAKLNIAAIELRNFMSFGDYPTRLELSDLGPVLVLGEVVGDKEDEQSETSNGAGKSSLLTAFIWCLFGRTTTLPKPGDKIVNFYTKENCYVKIETTDGWVITRTRNVDGHDELLVQQAGEDVSHSTNTNAQKFLNQQFGLDFDIFTSSVFCGQMAKSFLETVPVKRKEALERILGLDRLNVIADVAKEKIVKTENEQSQLADKIENAKQEIERHTQQIEINNTERDNFEAEKQQKIAALNEHQGSLESELNNLIVYDIVRLKHKWGLVDKIKTKIEQLKSQITDDEFKIRELQRDIVNWEKIAAEPIGQNVGSDMPDITVLEEQHKKYDKLLAAQGPIIKQINDLRVEVSIKANDIKNSETAIKLYESKAGAVCPSCKQTITTEHTTELCEPTQAHITQLKMEQSALEVKLQKLRDKNMQLCEQIDMACPVMAMAEARRIVDAYRRMAESRANTEKNIKEALMHIGAMQDCKTALLGQIKIAQDTLEKNRPQVTIEAAEAVIAKQAMLLKEKARTAKAVVDLRSQKNPYDILLASIKKELQLAATTIKNLEKQRRDLDVVFAHFKYVHRSYADRRNIKKWLLDGLVPFLNRRIHYYLDAFGIDLHISFTPTLGEEMTKWDYELCSGGERKRIDLAIMFGLYDLYLAIYGPQCNLMILDEVDGKLDSKGVRAFTDIILNDFTGGTDRPRPDTILVVSHKTEMKNAFPAQIIMIRKEDSFSSIQSIA